MGLKQSQRGVVAAACQVGELTFSMPAPARHHDVLRAMHAAGVNPEIPEVQGFLDHRGLFLGRQTAKIMAFQFGQIDQDCMDRHPELFSEDLW